MRIGINLLALKPGVSGGIDLYVRNLLRELAAIDFKNDYVIFTNRANKGGYDVSGRNFREHVVNIDPRIRWSRVVAEQLYLPLLVIRYRLDVLHSPTYTFPLLAPCRGVVTICDSLYKVLPEAVDRAKRLFWAIFVPLSAHRCRRVITISEYSKGDIARFLRVTPGKVDVTPLGGNTAGLMAAQESDPKVLQRLGVHEPFVLTVAGLGVHKNSAAVVRALARLARSQCLPSLQYVITGRDYGARQQIHDLAHDLAVDEALLLAGYVSDEELAALYRTCLAYVSMSLFEGFGMTVVEAMAHGAPVVVSTQGSLPEIAGDAGVTIEPYDVEALATVLHRLATNPEARELMRQQGRERASQFTWVSTARKTLIAYERAFRDA